jgi:hypothetical protein
MGRPELPVAPPPARLRMNGVACWPIGFT